MKKPSCGACITGQQCDVHATTEPMTTQGQHTACSSCDWCRFTALLYGQPVLSLCRHYRVLLAKIDGKEISQ